jgi:CspA family cold shock protein
MHKYLQNKQIKGCSRFLEVVLSLIAVFCAYRRSRTGGKVLPERGRVKWFNENRGYGFIRREEGGNEVYVHYSNIDGEGFRTLSEGELVEFDILEGERGPEARNVKRI